MTKKIFMALMGLFFLGACSFNDDPVVDDSEVVPEVVEDESSAMEEYQESLVFVVWKCEKPVAEAPAEAPAVEGEVAEAPAETPAVEGEVAEASAEAPAVEAPAETPTSVYYRVNQQPTTVDDADTENAKQRVCELSEKTNLDGIASPYSVIEFSHDSKESCVNQLNTNLNAKASEGYTCTRGLSR